MMSRGSVIPEFLKSKNRGYVNVTDKRMTRFSITIEEGKFCVVCSKDEYW